MKSFQLKLPRLIEQPGDTKTAKETVQHTNALFDELRWFYDQGVKVSFRATRKGYVVNFVAAK